EQGVVEVVAVAEVVVGADRHAGGGEAGVLGQDLHDDRLHRLGEAGDVAGGEVLAATGLGGVLQQLLVGGEADGVGVDGLLAGDAGRHVLVGHVFGQVRQALAVLPVAVVFPVAGPGFAAVLFPRAVAGGQRPDPPVRLEVVGRLAIGEEDDVGALTGVLDGASVAVPRPRAGTPAAAGHQTLPAPPAIGPLEGLRQR